MYSQDMQVYIDHNEQPLTQVFAVGWLAKDQEFKRGTVDVAVKDKLKKILESTALAKFYRGLRTCNLCNNHPESQYIEIEGRRVGFPLAEIWIPYGERQVFAAPTKICHYMDVHEYLPPQEFIDAVRRFDIDFDWDGDLVYAAIASKFRTKGFIEAATYVELIWQGIEKEEIPHFIDEMEKFHQLPAAQKILQKIQAYIEIYG